METDHSFSPLPNDSAALGLITEVLADAVMVVNKAGNVLYANKATAELLERPIERIVNSHFGHPCVGAESTEIDLPTPSGVKIAEMRSANLHAPALYDEEVEVISLRDVTEQRHLQQQLHQSQKMESLGRMTGGIAHDFNNLLMVVRGNLQLLERLLTNEDEVDIVRDALEAAERGKALTKQMLAFGRRQSMEQVITGADDNVLALEKMLSHTLGSHIKTRLNLNTAQAKIMLDPSLLQSALLNLCINARDAMPSGGRLEIHTRIKQIDTPQKAICGQEIPPGQYVCIQVKDNGEGIPEALQQKIFDPFFTTKEQGKGTGLGLSSVLGFVNQAKGYMQLDSSEGQGTSFHLHFPVFETTESTPQDWAADSKAVPGDSKPDVLHVEPQTLLQQLVQATLGRQGYSVHCAANGQQALDVLRQHNKTIKFMLIDAVLPGGTLGTRLAEEAQLLVPGLKTLLTADETRAALVADSGYPLLQKPYHPEQLAKSVKQLQEQEQA